ncbi:hypothetical protein MPPM_4844 [Methylorubrum populi]|uniref:Uncharacterized protein n=1 Tax=Methylorubrum populi TaxID=223967 RepID=A0A160PIY6_9HYPH|nr:hypothetical protein [Methylorubrum populi]BAU93449.1 hypothetical protein MPPM_4844 [Methylorubrum populi]
MSTTTHQGAVGAETMTAGQVAHDAAYGLSPDSRLWQAQTENVRDFWRRAAAAVVALATPAPRTDGGMTAGEDANFGDAPHDLVSEIATQVLNLPWTRFGLTDPRSGHFDHDALADRHGDVQIIAEKALRDARASDAESAWPFERTRAYLLAELERLRADLHTIGEDLTGEQGKAASWLDVATGRAANVSSVLASAAPAQPAGAVPDGLRALSEAATQGEWYTESEKCDGSYGSGEDCGEGYLAYSILTDAEPRYGNPGVIAETSNSTLGVIHEESDEDGFTAWDETARTNTAFIVAAVNFVRTLLASHPAGQSAGSEAGTDALVDRFALALKAKLRAAEAKYGWQSGWLKTNWQAECQQGLVRHVGKGDPLDVAAYAAFCWYHGWPTTSRRSTELVTGAVIPTAGAIAAYAARYPDGSLQESSDNAIECWNRVAVAACLAEMPAPDSTRTGDEGTDWVLVPAKPTEEMIAAGWIDKEDVDPDDIYRAMIAARPAAPEAQ